LFLLWCCSYNYNTIRFCLVIIRTTSQEWQNELYYNCQNNVTRVIKTNCIIIVRTTSQEWQKRIVLIQFSLSLLWHCSDNYNAIRFCHSCDVFLTIIIQFCLSLLWRYSDNYNTIHFCHSYDVFLTIIIQFSFSLLWRCSDNYNTIRFYHSRDVVLTIIIQFSLFKNELYYNCQNNVTRVIKTNCIIIVRTTSQEWQKQIVW
jgi:hypothetical protein